MLFLVILKAVGQLRICRLDRIITGREEERGMHYSTLRLEIVVESCFSISVLSSYSLFLLVEKRITAEEKEQRDIDIVQTL